MADTRSATLTVKADLERELEDFSLNLHDVRARRSLGVRSRVAPGHWAHREPAPYGEPNLSDHSRIGRDLDDKYHGQVSARTSAFAFARPPNAQGPPARAQVTRAQRKDLALK